MTLKNDQAGGFKAEQYPQHGAYKGGQGIMQSDEDNESINRVPEKSIKTSYDKKPNKWVIDTPFYKINYISFQN